MTVQNCLNCEKQLTDAYCSGCGQKADTHRITIKNFIFHDLLHGVFHIEKGIVFTAKQALICPGTAALEYISGKRKRYYNVFYLVLIAIGIKLFFHEIFDFLIYQGNEPVQHAPYLNDASRKINEIFSQKTKIILFLFVPFAALNTFMLFRRKRLNLSEHAIISGMILLGILLVATLGDFLFYFNLTAFFSGTALSIVVAAVITFYVAYGYFNAFGTDYTRLGTAYRILLFFTLICFEVAILTFILIGFVTHWKFGAISIAPFG